MAPTGTISAPLGCYDEGTTSIEPDYTLVKWKQLAGGGSLKMFNRLALEGLRSLGYPEDFVNEAALEPEGDWYSVAVCSDGSYGIEKGLICSFPIRTTKDGGWEIVQGLPIDVFSQEKIDVTVNELKEERDAVTSLLQH